MKFRTNFGIGELLIEASFGFSGTTRRGLRGEGGLSQPLLRRKIIAAMAMEMFDSKRWIPGGR